MSVKTSIYDFFAYAIPGALVLLLLLHGVETLGGPGWYSSLIGSNFSNWFLFGVASYLSGFTLDPMFHYVTNWYRPLERVRTTAFENLVKRNPDLKIELNPVDWAIWFATIRRESLDLANEIDRFNAQSKMMRGLCCAALLSVGLILLYVLWGKFAAWNLAATPLPLAVAFLAIRQARRFKMMFFFVIFETVISRNEPFTRSTK